MTYINIQPGKNIIHLNYPNKVNPLGMLTVSLSNSDINRNSIYFFNNKDSTILKTRSQSIIWYNEISGSIDISCITNDVENIDIIYYSNHFKNIEYNIKGFEIINISQDEDAFIAGNHISTLDTFIEKMDIRFKTNKEKIKALIADEINNQQLISRQNDLNHFPLSEKTYDHIEISAMVDVLLSDKLTMGKKVKEFEETFASYIGSNYAVMVNSGSSANLLAMAVLSNFKYKNSLKRGDKIIIPTICWSTSVWPIIQMGLEPVFVDINIKTLNADIDKVEELLQNDDKIKGMVAVHILGNTINIEKLMKLKSKYNIILMEDTCESLGSAYNGKYLGTFGECGTYSFYFSHHITTIEGGMVVTDDFEIYELLKCLRAHGWSRGLSSYNSDTLDNRFCFVNIGYNLRPMEIQAAMGLVQLERLDTLNSNRIKNYDRIVRLINNNSSNKLTCFEKEPNSSPAWFALPFILNKKYKKNQYLEYLERNNILTRPIVTGNFARQPVFTDLNLNINPEIFVNAETVHNQGFFIGLPSYYMSDEKIEKLVTILLNYRHRDNL